MMRTDNRSRAVARVVVYTALALGCLSAGTVALYQVFTAYSRAIEQVREGEALVAAVVSKRDLLPGVPITEHDLYLVELALGDLPDGVFLNPDHVIGRIPRERILHNELIRAERLADPERGEGLNAIIPRHMRALSVNVKDAQAVSGLLRPASYVDVLATVRLSDTADPETVTVGQAVFVLAVDDRVAATEGMGKEAEGLHDPSVTLLVSAHEAERIAHAENTGRLHLALRNDADNAYAELHGIDVDSLRRRLAAPVAVHRVAQREPVSDDRSVRIIRGREVEDIHVSADGTLR